MTDESISAAEPMSAAAPGDLASRGTAQSLALGFESVEGACAMRAPFRADLVGDPDAGGLAGGVITTLLDQTCGMAVAFAMRALNPDEEAPRRFGSMATLDFRIDFVRGLAYEDDPGDPIAAAQAAFMLTELPPGA
jgi:acyl-coenzyme A thioesterase PaaI-like protein